MITYDQKLQTPIVIADVEDPLWETFANTADALGKGELAQQGYMRAEDVIDLRSDLAEEIDRLTHTLIELDKATLQYIQNALAAAMAARTAEGGEENV